MGDNLHFRVRGQCSCQRYDVCFHGPCIIIRRLRWGRVVIENGAGYVRLARAEELMRYEDKTSTH